jgi:hypothetical protein
MVNWIFVLLAITSRGLAIFILTFIESKRVVKSNTKTVPKSLDWSFVRFAFERGVVASSILIVEAFGRSIALHKYRGVVTAGIVSF